MPGMIAASAAGGLFVSKKDSAVRRPAACRGHGVRIGRSRDRGEMQLARIDGGGEIRFERGKIEHSYRDSAVMVMDMSAALAEWVSAPTLMKSTPVSANERMFSSTMPPEASVGIHRLSF